jgi:DNA-binding transcriptional regulator YdaS (Cro superfamily)
MMESGTFIELIRHFETQAALARAMGVTPSAISQWVRRGSIPAEHAIAIERVTEGKFKAVDLA